MLDNDKKGNKRWMMRKMEERCRNSPQKLSKEFIAWLEERYYKAIKKRGTWSHTDEEGYIKEAVEREKKRICK